MISIHHGEWQVNRTDKSANNHIYANDDGNEWILITLTANYHGSSNTSMHITQNTLINRIMTIKIELMRTKPQTKSKFCSNISV